MDLAQSGAKFCPLMFRTIGEEISMTSNHVLSALNATGVPAEVLTAPQKKALVVKLRERLGVNVRAHAFWDDKTGSDGQQRADGWKLIPTYVGVRTCLMFLGGADIVWKFRNSSDLLRVLNECPPLEFYVCDQDASYLLCHNHHDFIIGWGVARSWVDRLACGG
jgi:hypothetical protein